MRSLTNALSPEAIAGPSCVVRWCECDGRVVAVEVRLVLKWRHAQPWPCRPVGGRGCRTVVDGVQCDKSWCRWLWSCRSGGGSVGGSSVV